VRTFALALVGAAAACAMAQPASPGKTITDRMGIEQRLGMHLPLDVPFVDASGREIVFGDALSERPVILLPIFYSCSSICSLLIDEVVRSMVKMPEMALGTDYDIVAFSIHPKETYELARGKQRNTVDEYLRLRERARHPADAEAVAAGVRFLTGDEDSIRRLTEALGFRYTFNPRTGQINHPAGIMVLTPSGRVSKYFYGASYPTVLMRKALEEAAEEKIGSKGELILLGCVMLDPETGQRTIVIQNVLRLLAGLTVLVLAISIITMTVKTRRQEAARDRDLPPGEGSEQ
jgi:protein SCO1